ncbi:hypothetical protein Tco_1482463 [Tanacetum coccineum]
MRLDVSKFNGDDSESWIFAINEYFTLLATPDEQRLRVVGFNLEGEAAEWLRWMTRNKLMTSWDGFLDSVRNRFGPSKYEDLLGVLSKIKSAYLFYISGLKPTIQREFLIAKPTTLGNAFSLARITEARLEDQAPASVPATNTTASVVTKKQSTPYGYPAISPERQERLNKGLCFNCDNRLVRGHKCPRKFLLLMADDGDDTGQEPEADVVEAVESDDISILILVGHESKSSFSTVMRIRVVQG